MARNRKHFWNGFTVGFFAGSATGALVLLARNTRALSKGRIRRVERSVQIARPVDDVFQLFLHPERLSEYLPELESVTVDGDRQHWRARVDGTSVEWDAEVTQVLPHQAIGWKSVTGPKHTGRINFAPLGRDVEVHVVMNYAPAARWFAPFASRAGVMGEALVDQVGRIVENGLSHVKQALEGKGFDVSGSGSRRPPESVAPAAEAAGTDKATF
jgi:uncharacterized membrane protein